VISVQGAAPNPEAGIFIPGGVSHFWDKNVTIVRQLASVDRVCARKTVFLSRERGFGVTVRSK